MLLKVTLGPSLPKCLSKKVNRTLQLKQTPSVQNLMSLVAFVAICITFYGNIAIWTELSPIANLQGHRHDFESWETRVCKYFCYS